MLGAMDFVWLKVPAWAKREGFIHGFLGRKGGKSQGAYDSLNLSLRVGDDPLLVKDNLCNVKKAVGVHDLRVVTMHQIHGDRIVEVKDKNLKEAGEADGMVTEQKEVFLGVLTADCVPILFSVPSRRVTAIVHAGWRGTMAGLASKMVSRLREQYRVGPDAIEVALGPAIGPCCYEIGEDVSAPLLARWKEKAEQSMQKKDNKQFLDLRNLNILLLQQSGVPPGKIFTLGPCTACSSEEFFSYRYDSAQGEKDTGRQLSFIGRL